MSGPCGPAEPFRSDSAERVLALSQERSIALGVPRFVFWTPHRHQDDVGQCASQRLHEPAREVVPGAFSAQVVVHSAQAVFAAVLLREIARVTRSFDEQPRFDLRVLEAVALQEMPQCRPKGDDDKDRQSVFHRDVVSGGP